MSEFRALVEGRLREMEERVRPLIERRDALKAQLDETVAEIGSLLPMLMEVTKAAQAIGIESDNISGEPDHAYNDDASPAKGGITIKQAIREVLNDSPFGLNSGDILDNVNKKYWEGKLDRTSFSPQLSRMKRDGEVDLKAGVYKVTQQGLAAGNLVRRRFRLRFGRVAAPENESSGVSPPNDSDAGSAENLFD